MVKGQTVWIIEHNRYVTPVMVRNVSYGFVTIAMPDGAYIRLRESRCFTSKDAAAAHVKRPYPVVPRALNGAKPVPGYRAPALH